MEEQVKFYQKQYSENSNVNPSVNEIRLFLGPNCHLPTIDEQQQLSCEGSVTQNEASQALQNMKNGSAPGCDGLTTEFYKTFWQHLAPMLIDSCNTSFEKGELSTTQQRGIISLIHKGKDLEREKLCNWRPITLLNTDYKILAKALSNRLKRVIKTVVREDQRGFISEHTYFTVHAHTQTHTHTHTHMHTHTQ